MTLLEIVGVGISDLACLGFGVWVGVYLVGRSIRKQAEKLVPPSLMDKLPSMEEAQDLFKDIDFNDIASRLQSALQQPTVVLGPQVPAEHPVRQFEGVIGSRGPNMIVVAPNGAEFAITDGTKGMKPEQLISGTRVEAHASGNVLKYVFPKK